MKRRFIAAGTLLVYPFVLIAMVFLTAFLAVVVMFKETQFKTELRYLLAIIRGKA